MVGCEYQANGWNIQIKYFHWLIRESMSAGANDHNSTENIIEKQFGSHRTIWVINFNVKAFELNSKFLVATLLCCCLSLCVLFFVCVSFLLTFVLFYVACPLVLIIINTSIRFYFDFTFIFQLIRLKCFVKSVSLLFKPQCFQFSSLAFPKITGKDQTHNFDYFTQNICETFAMGSERRYMGLIVCSMYSVKVNDERQ